MLGEFKSKIRHIFLYVLSIMPRPNSLEFIRGKGNNADCNITVDGYGNGFGIYYNAQITDDYEILFEKSNINAGAIEFSSSSKQFLFFIADGINKNEGDGVNWLIPLSIWGQRLDLPDLRVGIGGVMYPEANLHVKGKVRIDDTTSTTASAGTATLPSAPKAFLTINISGTDYKIPLYGV